MAIISFDKDTLIDYIPAYGDNRKSEDPCVVRLRFVPYAKVQEYSRLIAAKARGVQDLAKAGVASAEVQKKQFVESVESVSGFIVSGRLVTDAADLYDNAPAALIYELLAVMEDSAKLSEGQRKN